MGRHNNRHRHSHIKYVTPRERYEGRDRDILGRRQASATPLDYIADHLSSEIQDLNVHGRV